MPTSYNIGSSHRKLFTLWNFNSALGLRCPFYFPIQLLLYLLELLCQLLLFSVMLRFFLLQNKHKRIILFLYFSVFPLQITIFPFPFIYLLLDLVTMSHDHLLFLSFHFLYLIWQIFVLAHCFLCPVQFLLHFEVLFFQHFHFLFQSFVPFFQLLLSYFRWHLHQL